MQEVGCSPRIKRFVAAGENVVPRVISLRPVKLQAVPRLKCRISPWWRRVRVIRADHGPGIGQQNLLSYPLSLEHAFPIRAGKAEFSGLLTAVETSVLHIQTLQARSAAGTRDLMLYLTPKTRNEAVPFLDSASGQILAGGTDFYPGLGERLPEGNVVDIAGVNEIRG